MRFKASTVLVTALAMSMFAAVMAVSPRPASAQDDAPVYASGNAAVRAAKIDIIQDELRQEARELAERARHARSAKRAKQGKAGRQPMLLERWDEQPSAEAGAASAFGVARPMRVEAIPTNAQHNNKAGDAANTTQSENSIAMDGQYGVASWNDGLGGAAGYQGMAYTTNGGATWTDIGSLPVNGTITSWNGDPVCAVNTTTHEFYVVGFGIALQQIAMVKISFPAGVFTMTGPFLVHQRSGTDQIDKPWFTADAVTGNLYCTWTNFTAGTDRVEYKRSIDNGATWSAVQIMNSAGTNGLIQGSRPQVGIGGVVYVCWYEIGAVDADFITVRKSIDNGATFAAELHAVSFFTAFGSGAPGFNRLRSVDFPSIAVDRTTGPNAGRAYIGFQESVNWYDDALGGSGSKSEVESNNTVGTATPFTAGQRLRGSLATASSSPDYWSFPATQGTTYIFWCDSLSAQYYTMRIYCTDGVSSLAAGGDNSSPAGGQGFVVWTAPTTATYYMRMATIAGGTNGGYRVQTGINANPGAGTEVSRDHRDVFVSRSDNGTSWTKTRVNTEPGYFDDFLPEVQVPCDGYPYVMWYDWHDAANCGGNALTYTARSTDGGATWSAGAQIASAATNFNTAQSNLAPNMGDYIGLYGASNGKLGMAWGDGRLGDVDEFGATVDPTYTVSNCPASQTVLANTAFNINALVNNLNVVFGNNYNWSLTVNRSWPGFPLGGATSAAAGGSGSIVTGFVIPDTAAHNRSVHLCLTVTCVNGGCSVNCCFDLLVLNPVTPALASLASVTAEPGSVKLAWLLEGTQAADVERSDDGASWTMIGDGTTNGEGYLEFTDTDVAAGSRYAYRLSFLSDGQRVRSGQTWVSVPTGVDFALKGAVPNPSKAGFSVTFSLAGQEAAQLELLDLAGRHVLTREVGHFGAGTHTLSLERDTALLAPGVYHLRLTQGSRVAHTRVSVVR